jgi:hypothetical protein
MGLDTKTYWLTDRQSQCGFDLTLTCKFAVSKWMQRHSNQFSESELVIRYERSTRTEYKRSACEDLLCEIKTLCVIVQGELGLRNPMRSVWLPCYEYVKTAVGRVKRLACNDCKLCNSVIINCSYDLWVANKTNYHTERRLSTQTRYNINIE